MSTRWSAGLGWNALHRLTVTSPHEDPLHLLPNLYDELPLKAARFTVPGQNDVLVDADLLAGAGTGTFMARAGETLVLKAGTGITIFNERTRDFLRNDLSWGATEVLTVPKTFVVQAYDRMQRDWCDLTVGTGSAGIVVPALDSLTIHGHEGLYQATDAIQWHSGAAADPTGLVVQALPLAFSQLLSAPAPVTDQFHRISFFGNLPFIGEAVLCALRSITRCSGSGRVLRHELPKAELSNPAGVVDAYAWAVRETRSWQGTIRGNAVDVSALKELLTRASKNGASPMLFVPEDGVVMVGRVGPVFDPRTRGPVTFDMQMAFDESPLLLAEEA